MCKWIFYLIYELAMDQYEEEVSNIDRLLLIFRRVFILLVIIIVIWVLLFKIIGINKNSDLNKEKNYPLNLPASETSLENSNTWEIEQPTLSPYSGDSGVKNIEENLDEEAPEVVDLWKRYTKIDSEIYYRGKKLDFVDADKFTVIDQKGRYHAQWIVANSNNLLQIFANSKMRVLLMKQIDDLIANEKNVTKELKSASENGMYKMESQYATLSQFDRNDRYEMTNEQRAKFAIMFLYVKIAKSMSNGEVVMEVALQQLKEFLENFDEDDLKKEISQNKITKIRWNIGMDDYCIYVNGKLYTCFLDKIFVK